MHAHRLSRFSVWLFAALWTVACKASLSMGFSRQVLYPLSHQGSPILVAAAAAKLLQSCPTLWDPRDGVHSLQLEMWLLTFSQAHSLLVYTFQFHRADDFIHLNASNRKMSGIMLKGRSPKIIHSRGSYILGTFWGFADSVIQVPMVETWYVWRSVSSS